MRSEADSLTTRSLAVLCVVLALVILAEWRLIERDKTIQVAKDASVELAVREPTSIPYASPGFDEFGAILTRPVFFQDRRLPQPPATKPVPTLEPLRLRLEGVAMVGDARVAVLRSLVDNGLVQLTEGMAHGSWSLESVTADSAVFRRGEEVSELSLELDNGYAKRR